MAGKFLTVVCPRCNSKQIVFGKATTGSKCKKCNYMLSRPGGGKSKIRAKVKEVLQ